MKTHYEVFYYEYLIIFLVFVIQFNHVPRSILFEVRGERETLTKSNILKLKIALIVIEYLLRGRCTKCRNLE